MSVEGRIAIVEDDPFLRDQLTWALKGRFDVRTAADARSGLLLLADDPDILLIDLRLPPTDDVKEGLELLRAARQRKPDATVIVMSGEAERRHALQAVQMGAFDFFRKPFEAAELQLVLTRAMERRRLLAENQVLREEARRQASFGRLVGASPPMRSLFRAIEKVAPDEATVLLCGESGTGKELVARAIHDASPRRGGPFVPVSGSALPENLAESELFGHEKGAFTGAVAARTGRFELAHGGTLFLDEIATLSAAIQVKLLRVLEARQFERVGGTRTISVDLRLIAATNVDLERLVKGGAFREDLFYRINTVILRIPPLRERPGDVPLLVELFAERAARRRGTPPKRFSGGALAALEGHPFPGNVRELEHLVEMLTLMVEEDEIRPEHLPGPVLRTRAPLPAAEACDAPGLPMAEAVARYERDLLTRAIAHAGGIKAQAARALGLDRNQMKYLCRKYGL